MLLSLSRLGTVRSFVVTSFPHLIHKRPWMTQGRSASIYSLVDSAGETTSSNQSNQQLQQEPMNLMTIEKDRLQERIVSWGFPKYRSEQVWKWIRNGVTSIDEMTNLPQPLKMQLQKYTHSGSLHLDTELISKDGTRKRAYRLHDGQLIESVLMPYDDGRYTACISSQAGCAMGCVFCATGQMGFARQLTPEEIFEQVARFDMELKRMATLDPAHATDDRKEEEERGGGARLSNIVFMGMGEPLANYRNVRTAVNRITKDLGIGARKITISTVGVVPNIRKLFLDPEMPQVRLAVSLHCATNEERTKLLPANARYGGLDELMMTLKEYIDTTNRRITLEWALIEDQNDDPSTAKQLGNLVKRFGIRRDMIHVNVIPLNPTGGFGGSPSGRARVNEFCATLVNDFGITCTPRVRRGIDINAGCGQLKATLEKKQKENKGTAGNNTNINESRKTQSPLQDFLSPPASVTPQLGVYEDDEEEDYKFDQDDDQHFELSIESFMIGDSTILNEQKSSPQESMVATTRDFIVETDAIDLEEDDYDDYEFTTDWELNEAQRLVSLVQSMPLSSSPSTKTAGITTATTTDDDTDAFVSTTTITDEEAIQEAKKRRKKILKNLKAIDRLLERKRNDSAFELNAEQASKVAREMEWRAELESVEHNLQ